MSVSRAKVHHLYYAEKKSLRAIGTDFGLSGSRIHQLMKKWNLPRRKSKRRKGQFKFNNLVEYLHYRRILGKGATHTPAFFRLVKPYKICCENCGRTAKLKVKFLKKSILRFEDFKILCSYCLQSSVRRGVDGNQVREICDRFLAGMKTTDLARKYGLARISIYKILEREGIGRRKML